MNVGIPSLLGITVQFGTPLLMKLQHLLCHHYQRYEYPPVKKLPP